MLTIIKRQTTRQTSDKQVTNGATTIEEYKEGKKERRYICQTQTEGGQKR